MEIAEKRKVKPHYRYDWRTQAIRIVQARNAFDYSRRQLNRARRLYKYMIHVRVFQKNKAVPYKTLAMCAVSAKLRGLWARTTQIRDIVYAFVTFSHKYYSGGSRLQADWKKWCSKKVPDFWYDRANKGERHWLSVYGLGCWPWEVK